MRSQFSITCILRSAIFISPLILSSSAAAEPGIFFTASEEVEKHATDLVENIHNIAVNILSVPPEEQTFENTLKPWNRLSAELSQGLDALNALSNLDLSSSATAVEVYNKLQAYLLEVTQNPELRQALINCSLSIAHNPKLDPFQRYIGARFIKNNSNELVYLCGAEEGQNTFTTDYTVLNITWGSITEAQVSELAYKILSENAGVVCIQEVAADDYAYDLYKVLHKNYAHFVYVPPSLNLAGHRQKNGMLIASKFGGDGLEVLLARSHKDRNEDRGGASLEGGFRGSWGDGNGIHWEGYAKAEAHDGRGNYAEAEVTQKDDGTGSVDVRGGHDSENK